MIILKGPYPNFTRTLILPNPDLGDSYTPIRELDVKRAVDGTVYSYLKTTTSVRLLFNIQMTRQKSLELEDFYKLNAGNKIELVNHKDIRYLAIFISELDKRNFKKSWYNPSDLLGSEEAVTISLEFEGDIL
jgi:hypothetical protein